MNAYRKNLYLASIFAAAAQFMGIAAQAATVQLNGTCLAGSCSSSAEAGAIGYGASIPTTPFSFDYTFANTDMYAITGTYAASYGASGSVYSVSLGVTYLGNSGSGTSAADALTIDILQDIYDPSPGTFDGTYTESIPLSISGPVGAGSNASGQLLWDGQSVGMVGPFVGDGTYFGSNSANLTGLTGDYLAGDFQFLYNFSAGTAPGAGASVPFGSQTTTPEPVETIPVALAFGIYLCVNLRKRRLVNVNSIDRNED